MLMIGKQLSVEQRLTKAIVDIMGNNKYTALAGVLMVGSREVDDKLPTACTNGKDEKYGRAFVEILSDAELRFIVLHECYHKLYKHLTTWRWMYDENPQLANAACDYVINVKISDDNSDGFAKMPMKDGKPLGLLDYKYRGMNAAEVYNLLKKEQKEGSGGGKGSGAGQGNAGTSSGDGSSSGSGSGSGSGSENAPQGFDEHDWDGAQEMSEGERKALERELDEAIRQGALVAGKMGSGGARDLEELLQAKIDWREALREFISTTCAGNDYSTWRRPNRRFVGMGHYMPSGVSEQVGELVIAIDTSGSIGGAELARFLGEVKGIAETVHPEAVRLLYWDTQVCADEKYVGTEVENITSSTKPAGGGGTEVNCVHKYLAEHSIKPQAIVILTDGYLGGSWGTAEQWSAPVLWCICGGNKAVADVGKTIYVED